MLSDRKKHILKTVIDEYIQSAEPVGSKSVASMMGLSSATIRNEMAELEALGYLVQPHTSAGRIPSHAGYRLYVNELMRGYALTKNETDDLNSALRLKMQELDRLLMEAGRAVSELTRFAAVAAAPDVRAEGIHRYEIITYDPYSCIAVLITKTGIVRNKLIRLSSGVTPEDAANLSRLLNAYMADRRIDSLDEAQIASLEGLAGSARPIVVPVLEFAAEVELSLHSQDLFLEGAANLLDYPEYKDVYRARELIDFLTGNPAAKTLAPLGADDTIIKIGGENHPEALKNSSIVLTRYHLGKSAMGFIGVIGPTRMDYARVQARLKYFAEGLSRVFADVFPESEYDAPPGEAPESINGSG